MTRTLVGLVVLVVLCGGLAGSSSASFAGRAENRGNAYAFTALYAGSGLTATTSGHDVGLSWSAGTNGSGYSVLGVANGSSSDCSSASFAAIGSIGGTSYTDTGRYTPQGTWFCYQVKTSYGSSWTSVSGNPTAAAQLGVVAVSALAANGGSGGKLDAGDTITITFNQAISTSSGPSGTNTVCTVNGSDTVMIGSTTTTGACTTSETVKLGTLTGGTLNRTSRYSATYAWSNGNKTLTVTIGARTVGANDPNMTGSWALNPTTTAASLLSATGSFHACDTNTGGGACLPALTGSF